MSGPRRFFTLAWRSHQNSYFFFAEFLGSDFQVRLKKKGGPGSLAPSSAPLFIFLLQKFTMDVDNIFNLLEEDDDIVDDFYYQSLGEEV